MSKPIYTVLLSVLLILVGAYTPASAQSPKLESSASYQFGESITFQAVVQSNQAIEAATIYFQAENDTRTNLGEVEVSRIDDF